MEQRPRSTSRTIAEWLPILVFIIGSGLVVVIGKVIAPTSIWVAFTIMSVFLVGFIGTFIYSQNIKYSNSAKGKNLRKEVLKMLACCSYEWSEPRIHGIGDIYDVKLSECDKKNEYKLTIFSTHVGILIGKKGANLDLIHSVIDNIFGYKITIELKEPELFKNLHK